LRRSPGGNPVRGGREAITEGHVRERLDGGGAVQRRLGAKAVLAIVGGAVAIGIAVNVVAARHQASDRPAACRPAHPTYGRLPDGLSYAPASAALRRRTLRALRVDQTADLRLVRRGGATYGEVVGVPTTDPQRYVDNLVDEAHGHGESGRGYALMSFGSNDVVAVGARGCRAVYVAAATPDDVKVLAPAVLSG
jgi:hypothetical protein